MTQDQQLKLARKVSVLHFWPNQIERVLTGKFKDLFRFAEHWSNFRESLHLLLRKSPAQSVVSTSPTTIASATMVIRLDEPMGNFKGSTPKPKLRATPLEKKCFEPDLMRYAEILTEVFSAKRNKI